MPEHTRLYSKPNTHFAGNACSARLASRFPAFETKANGRLSTRSGGTARFFFRRPLDLIRVKLRHPRKRIDGFALLFQSLLLRFEILNSPIQTPGVAKSVCSRKGDQQEGDRHSK